MWKMIHKRWLSIIVVAAMVLFDMLYMKKDKKEELPQEEKKV